MAHRVGVICDATIKMDFVSGFLDVELLNDKSKSLVSTNLVWNNLTRQSAFRSGYITAHIYF